MLGSAAWTSARGQPQRFGATAGAGAVPKARHIVGGGIGNERAFGEQEAVEEPLNAAMLAPLRGSSQGAATQ